jgi:hypothetical protein
MGVAALLEKRGKCGTPVTLTLQYENHLRDRRVGDVGQPPMTDGVWVWASLAGEAVRFC